MHEWITVNSNVDLDQLSAHISAEYAPEIVADRLKDGVSDAVKGILIEHEYIDKDYRSTYYNFYSKKGHYYRPDCVRLHFFDQEVRFEADRLTLSSADQSLKDHYFGFMVLRPTGIGTVGRSVLSPDIRKGAGRYIITASYKVHLLGYELTVDGFPSMDQHADISVCAHAASWAILRHYSESYKIYRERLLHDITMMAQEYNPGGLVPSLGLALSHAERIFQEAKTFPLIVAREMANTADMAFYRQLMAYVESKFPLFAANHKANHAVAIIGYDWRAPLNTQLPGVRYSWDEVESFAVIDDHHLPYFSIPKSGGQTYSVQDIDSFIVALPEKLYYPADAVDRIAPEILKMGSLLGLPSKDETIIRYFVTTGAALRRFVRKHASEYDSNLFKAIMLLPYAQFIWVVEFATEAQWAVNQVAGRAIIDATASPVELYPYWLIHGAKGALIFERETVNETLNEMSNLSYSMPGRTGFSRMDQNLRRTR